MIKKNHYENETRIDLFLIPMTSLVVQDMYLQID